MLDARMRQPPSFDFSPCWMARVVLCAAALVGAAWALAAPITAMLASSCVSWADEHTAAWTRAHTSPAAMTAFAVLTWLHSTAGILVLAAVLGGCMWNTRWRAMWPLLLASVPGGLLLNVAVKQAVHRARPEWGYAYEPIASYSFPSGHTAGATAFYGFVALLLYPSLRSPLARFTLLVVSVAMVLLVACSRIALGVHFLSDCMAASCEAALWLTVCWTGVRLPPIDGKPLWHRRAVSAVDGPEHSR